MSQVQVLYRPPFQGLEGFKQLIPQGFYILRNNGCVIYELQEIIGLYIDSEWIMEYDIENGFNIRNEVQYEEEYQSASS